jgi:polyphenol oxidase
MFSLQWKRFGTIDLGQNGARPQAGSRCCNPRKLNAVPGIRHAFFTRAGGVSDGVYGSLNGGVGSDDTPSNVSENRARMAAALSVSPDRLLTAYQIHSPDVVVAERPWPADARPRADAIVTRAERLAIGVSTADCGPVLLADGTAG